jgi:hypothetical protein
MVGLLAGDLARLVMEFIHSSLFQWRESP